MSTETASFLSQLAKARARQETALMRRRAEQAWRMRWGSILACATARQSPHLCSVWARRMTRMVTHPPTHEVEGDHGYAGFVP